MTPTEQGYWALFVSFVAIPPLVALMVWWATRTERKAEPTPDPNDEATIDHP